MDGCCGNCVHKKKLLKWVYLDNGEVTHEECDGFLCDALGFEGTVVHMVGVNPVNGFCEMYKPKEIEEYD